MTDIKGLIAIDEIKRLKSRYFYRLGHKDWCWKAGVRASDARPEVPKVSMEVVGVDNVINVDGAAPRTFSMIAEPRTNSAAITRGQFTNRTKDDRGENMTQLACVVVVTGASRGAGRGIAIALGSHGCTVYITGRSEQAGDATLPGTIHETAKSVTAAGGKGIAVRVDHADDAQVKALFEQVQREQGRLDILVNNACLVRDEMMHPLNFWEKPLNVVDMLDVGLRSSYVASYFGAPMITAQRKGLVIFTSASGAVHYVFDPAYGAHKAGMDKFAADMAVDFKPFGVAALSIWMGPLLAERLKLVIESDPKKFGNLADTAETPEFTGHIIWALYNDPALMELTGQTVIGAEMAVKYGIRDTGGRQPPSYRVTHGVEPRVQYPNIIR